MPRPVLECVGIATRSRASKVTVPLATLSSPITLFISVVLPAPLRPIKPTIAPVGNSSVTSRRICTDWIATFRLTTLSMVARLAHAADHVALDLRVLEGDVRRRVGDDAPVVKR